MDLSRVMRALCCVLVATLGRWGDAAGAPPVANGSSEAALIDVPYVSQTEALCGGAAVAMVLRYWGERGVHAADFAALVDESAAGIRTGVLAQAVRDLGWRALPFAGSDDDLRSHVAKGRPVIALIEDRPGRYHYVVVTGWVGDRVVFHDPARAPFRVLDRTRFDRVWSVTGRWALLVLPMEDRRLPAEPGAPEALREDACTPLVADAVGRASAGDLHEAEVRLDAARLLCPSSAAPWRELAGVRFLEKRWRDAAELAAAAVRLDPQDEHAWRVLATSRFLDDDRGAALRAWNRLHEPRIDLVRINGLARTRHRVVESWLALSPRDVLTDDDLARARRRLSALPSATSSRLDYQPVENGLAEVTAVIVERPLLPLSAPWLVAIGAQAAVSRELPVAVASATGAGELWQASWRWFEARPRFAVGLAAPLNGRVRGLARASAFVERQSYATSAPDAPSLVEERKRAAVALGDWATGTVRWDVEAGIDRWQRHGAYVSIAAALEKRMAHDRVAITWQATGWVPAGESSAFGAWDASAAWRSRTRRTGVVLTGRAALQTTTAAAPSDIWPGASTGEGRPVLLRAHPLLRQGVIEGETIGRTLASGGIEVQRWLPVRSVPARLAVAVFADAARAFDPLPPRTGSRTHVDAGTGIRVILPGTASTLRLDAAVGLRDGRTALSAGWVVPW